MRYSVELFMILVLTSVFQVQNWRPFSFHFEQIQCQKISELMSFLNCSLDVQTKLVNAVNFDMKFGNVVTSPEFDLVIFMVRKNQPEFILANLTHINGCDFLQNKGIFKLLDIIRNEIGRFSTLPPTCPVAKNTEIHVRNLTLNVELFPPYVPEGKFSVNVHLSEKFKLAFTLQINGSVINKSSKRRGIRLA